MDVCDGNMEEGSFRCDANVSLRLIGSQRLGTRAEIKNLNSFKNVGRAIRAEVIRQYDLICSNQPLVQCTLLFDPTSGKTQVMRSKTDEKDYRYFPDPDLQPLIIKKDFLEKVVANLPELPDQKQVRYQNAYALTASEAAELISSTELCNYFESLVAEAKGTLESKKLYHWLLSDLAFFAKTSSWEDIFSKCPPVDLLKVIRLVETENKVSRVMAKKILRLFFQDNVPLDSLLTSDEFSIKSDRDLLENTLSWALKTFPDAAEQLRKGDLKVMGFFVGQMVKHSGGQLDPKLVSAELRRIAVEEIES